MQMRWQILNSEFLGASQRHNTHVNTLLGNRAHIHSPCLEILENCQHGSSLEQSTVIIGSQGRIMGDLM
jgi:hypothetical protein